VIIFYFGLMHITLQVFALLLAVPPPWGSHLSDEHSPPPASLQTVPLGSDHPLSTHLAMVRSTKYTGPGSPSSHLKRKEEAPRKNNNPRKKEKVCGRACQSRRLCGGLVTHAEARDHVVWW